MLNVNFTYIPPQNILCRLNTAVFFNYEEGEWSFVYYPLDTCETLNGGWVGLSDISTAKGKDYFVIERDNQGGTDARIKRI